MERRRLRQNFFETCLTDKTTSSGKSGDWLLEIGDWECMVIGYWESGAGKRLLEIGYWGFGIGVPISNSESLIAVPSANESPISVPPDS